VESYHQLITEVNVLYLLSVTLAVCCGSQLFAEGHSMSFRAKSFRRAKICRIADNARQCNLQRSMKRCSGWSGHHKPVLTEPWFCGKGWPMDWFLFIFLLQALTLYVEYMRHSTTNQWIAPFCRNKVLPKNQDAVAVGQLGYWTLICSYTALWGLIVLPRQNGKLGTHNCHNQCSSGHTKQC
jgi:hypothetical protein